MATTGAAPEVEATVVLEPGEVPSDDANREPCRALALPLPVMLERIHERLAAYLGSGDALTDFQAQAEWDLATQGRLSETDILQAYALATSIPVADEELFNNVDTFPEITVTYLNQWLCVPLSWDSKTVLLAVATPYHLGTIAHHWQSLLGRTASFYLAQRSHVERMITGRYDHSLDTADENILSLDLDTSEEALRDLALEAPIVRLVNDMFARAVELDASDVHVEPSENQLAIRFRVDGVLQTAMTPPISSYAAIASRLKLIGGLNIAERRLPQDGRTDLHVGRAHIDVRISTVPSMHGESIVLRILRKDITSYSLRNIGMDEQLKTEFSKLIQLPHGMILVVGPTGSGKTTTLYCAMNMLKSDEKKIITIEDPIEYQISGVTQIQVKPAIGLTFASGLRHIVRQDPDIILVGEIRDRETADIAIHAALTGHLVLSTLHTNDATGAISRLQDMGVEEFLISSALVGVMSQRLLRRVCPKCKGEGAAAGEGPAAPRPCRNCSGSGFRGRVGIFEYLRMNDKLREAIVGGADNATLNRIAREAGMRSLRQDGEAKAAEGVTTRAEVTRVCRLDLG